MIQWPEIGIMKVKRGMFECLNEKLSNKNIYLEHILVVMLKACEKNV